MSKEIMVLLVKASPDLVDHVENAEAKVFMRFTEEPSQEFLSRLAEQNPGWRVYSLIGASTWHEHETKPICSADGCNRTTPCGPFCRDNGNLDR